MKSALKCLGAAICGSFLVALPSRAEVTYIFDENFDNSPPYRNGGLLPTEEAQTRYGHWHSNKSAGNSSMLIASEQYASEPWSLALRVGGLPGSSSATGFFGNMDSIAPGSYIRWQVSFYVEDLTLGSAPFFAIRDANGKNLALLYIGDGGMLRPNNVESGAAISRGHWYRLDMVLAANPAKVTDRTYSLKVYDRASEELVYSGKLKFFESAEPTECTYATVNMTDISNVLYLDDWSVSVVSGN